MDVLDMMATLSPVDEIEAWLRLQASLPASTTKTMARARLSATTTTNDVVNEGIKAARALQEGDFERNLTRDEEAGLEALVLLVGRPALRILDGRVESPLPPGWAILEEHRDRIERIARSVGRLELVGHPLYPWAGTGFLVARDIIMTNRHVVKAFSQELDEAQIVFQAGVNAFLNLADEPDSDLSRRLPVTGVLGVHETLDLALISIEANERLEPLKLMQEMPDPNVQRTVAVIGYPAFDARNDPAHLSQVFGDVYGVKRLQPGLTGQFFADERLFRHDCSTVGGNSGSCVVDIETGDIMGLHFRGFYMEYNEAVALPYLLNDRLLATLH